jgi:16S rRNA (adenine1518-N6/adenine1519-N6)-dimethyltransferase
VKKPLGQHFLFDPGILSKIINSSDVLSEDTVVEIGAGPGTLTNILAERVSKVIALEIDERLIKRLRTSFKDNQNVEVIKANALRFPYDSLNGRFKVVANIPYYITTPLIFKLLEYKNKISSMTLLVQKEIAQRIVSGPGSRNYGVLSIMIQLYTDPVLQFLVPRSAFSPPPEVDSAVVFFKVFSEPRYKLKDEIFFQHVVKTAFSQRRKTLLNSLKSFEGAREALISSGIDAGLRPEVLSIDDFIKLSDALQKK